MVVEASVSEVVLDRFLPGTKAAGNRSRVGQSYWNQNVREPFSTTTSLVYDEPELHFSQRRSNWLTRGTKIEPRNELIPDLVEGLLKS